jgi:hypothetical protein
MLFMTFTGTGELGGVFGVGQTSETTVLLTVTDSIVGATATATQTSRLRGKISY